MVAHAKTAAPRKRLAALALTVAVLGCLACTALAGAAPLGGINIGALTPTASAARMSSEIAVARRLHAKVVRVGMPWSLFEPTAQGKLAPRMVTAANRLIEDAAAAHIKVIALLDDTPCWASTAPASLLADCGDGNKAEAWPPRDPSDFGAFTGWLAKRYGSQLAAIEVWNEPDQANEDYLDGPEKPRHYAELLKAAYPAIKRADPNVPVLAGSLVGPNGAFMKALYKQGIKGYYNGVAVHFYTLVLGSVRRFHEVQLENGDHTPLWLDEFGWSSCWPKYKIEQEQGCVTPAIQAQNITSSFHELARTAYVKALLTYGFKDAPGEEFGVLDVKGKPKPSFAALAKALLSPLGPPSPITLSLKARRGSVIATGSGPVGDYMKLEVFKGGRLREEKIFTLNRFNRYRLELNKTLGTSGLVVRVYQYWLGLSDYAQRSI